MKDIMSDMRIRLLYQVSAWSLIAALGVLVVLNLVAARTGAEALNTMPSILKIPLGLAGAAGALGFFALWSGMLWNCIVVSNRSVVKKGLWLLFIFFAGPIGALIYYFAAFYKFEGAHTPRG